MVYIVEESDVQGLIFDCDGTLCDTMPAYYHSWTMVCEKYGLEISEPEFYGMAGVPVRDMIQKLIDKAGKGDSLTVQEVFETKCVFGFEAMKKMGAPGIPCVIDIARKYHGKVPLAVASSGNREHVHKSLEDAGIHELFDAIITCEDVTNPKPAPDIYLKAAAAIKCDPTKCRGFEDGDVGMESLVAAGMEAVDVRYMSDYPRDINGMRGSIAPGR